MGNERLGPMDQVRLSQLNSDETSPLKYPAEPVSVNTGKNAALATPILALAEASWRSAWATSGRRSSKSDGSPAGISGGCGFQFGSSTAASLKLDGFSPTKIAMAFSNSSRCCA